MGPYTASSNLSYPVQWWRAMTVRYIEHVHTAAHFGTFLRLLAVWRGSIIKGVGRDLLFYCVLYGIISITYRTVISQYHEIKKDFEIVCVFSNKYQNYLPLDFILGFYVTQVIGRWWKQFEKLWWPDALAMDLAAFLPGSGYPRLIRRELIRLAHLSSVMALRRLSAGTAKRFPTLQHFVVAGLMTEKELILLENMDKVVESRHQITWVPISWAQARLQRARVNCPTLSSDFLYQTLHKDLQDVSDRNGDLISMNWVSIPLMYTQLVTLAVHIYFMSTLLGSQYLRPTQYIKDDNGTYVQVPWGTVDAVNLLGYDNTIRDLYIPYFTLLRFVFYFSWLHVAEILINPFGEDDEDFDVNYLIDRNVQISYLMLDAGEGNEELEEDPYEGNIPMALPHTVESIKTKEPDPGNLTDHIIENLKEEDMELVEEEDGPVQFSNQSMDTLNTVVSDDELEVAPLQSPPPVARVRYTTVA